MPLGPNHEPRNMFDLISMELYTSQYPINWIFRFYNQQDSGELKGVKI